jgi:hypothetical protein
VNHYVESIPVMLDECLSGRVTVRKPASLAPPLISARDALIFSSGV